MIELDRLLRAYQTARRDLLAERVPDGHWVGELSNSALSTATAISALALVARHTGDASRRDACRQLAARGIAYLICCQNDDGGWGDTDQSFSNIATTMLVRAALHLADAAGEHAELLGRAERYIDSQGGTAGLRRRYGSDKTFAVPILTNCALAGLAAWDEVDPLPFEYACLPHGAFRLVGLPVVSYAIPALVAIGQARFFHGKPRNPLTRLIRSLAVGGSLRTLRRMQPSSGGYLEATPLTSFVVMSLAGTGRADHEIARQGVKFLLASIRRDGSWPIDTNLATWNTTLAVSALAALNGNVGALACLDWLLECQHDRLHPLSHAVPGGWGWTDSSGAVPDADDTSGALLALLTLCNSGAKANRERTRSAVAAGVHWLLGLQNADGGWPTFCRGWGKLPFDRSGADLTAHALRALHAWQALIADGRTPGAISKGIEYLEKRQCFDGSWTPLWFGNQHHPREENPVYGTSRVLLAYRDLGQIDSEAAQRGLAWLAANQAPDGGWGGVAASESGAPPAGPSSVEETALAVEALLAGPKDSAWRQVTEAGIQWLVAAVEQGRYRETSPIGFYFAKLWYYERLYPLTFTVSALGRAVRQLAPGSELDPAPPPPGKTETAG
ncbi:MAG: squalene--hopene cyclase [Pirellulales bacterium]|nr:squalene--hopene cyclase [Pirellulales bacterium]